MVVLCPHVYLKNSAIWLCRNQDYSNTVSEWNLWWATEVINVKLHNLFSQYHDIHMIQLQDKQMLRKYADIKMESELFPLNYYCNLKAPSV